ncbi:MAG: zinc ribbon domain-containing protein [Nitrospira sp.]
MNCTSCEAALPLRARFCPSCGVQIKLPADPAFDESALQATGRGSELNERTAPALSDHEGLKARLINCYVNFSMSRELSDWLQELGLPSTGTMQEKFTRLRQRAGAFVLPAESLPRQTIWYLKRYDENILMEICQELCIDNSGPKESLVTRLYHTVGLREGWLQPLSEDARNIITETFLPILRAVDHRNYDDLDQWGELEDVFNGESRNRLGSQGLGSAFMAVLVPGLLQEAHQDLLQHELDARAGKPF